jgi:two-component system, NtrC family, response regulator HydG
MKTRLLLADADQAMSGLCRAYLTHFGYDVDTALDGAECLSKLQRRMPDLLLLDLDLPGGGGELVLAQLRGTEGPRVPVVMMADLMPFSALSGLRKPPVVRCIQRPIRIAALCDCIGSLIRPRGNQTERGASVPQASAKKRAEVLKSSAVSPSALNSRTAGRPFKGGAPAKP